MHKVFYLAWFQLLGSRSMGCSSVPIVFPWWQLHIRTPTRRNVLIRLSHLLCQLVTLLQFWMVYGSYLHLRRFASFNAGLYTIYQLVPNQHFAAVLCSALRSVLYDNTEESWIKLFLLPKCILSSSKRRGRHHKPTFIKYLCELWSNENFEVLW